jgi:3-methyladenine DNA glycosylase AlkD
MDSKELVAQISAWCAANADPAVVAKYKGYFKEGYDAYGLQRGLFDAKAKELFEAHKGEMGIEEFLDTGDLLVQNGMYEEGSFAIRFVIGCRKQLARGHFERIGAWLDAGLRNWAHTDFLSSDVLGYFLVKGIVPLEDFAEWRVAGSKWKRRAVPVSMLEPLKTATDVRPLLDFIRPMMHDPERVVHQGLGWFLRETWKRHAEPVEAFLLEFKDTSPRLIFQYATEKMTREQKERFRKAKA